MIDITPAFVRLTPGLTDIARREWLASLVPAMQSGGINTVKRAAMFLGQCAVECEGFTRMDEDLFYTSAARIHEVWPIEFPDPELAAVCVGKPELLANHVYAPPRSGNQLPNDGWTFRGRGPLMLTGRQTHHDCWEAIAPDVDFETVFPDFVATPRGGALSAVWFWGHTHHGLNPMADAWSISDVTRAIRGSVARDDFSQRIKWCSEALAALSAASHHHVAIAQTGGFTQGNTVTADTLNAEQLAKIGA